MSVYTNKDDPNSIVIGCDCGWVEHEAFLSFWPDVSPYPTLFLLEFHLVDDGLFDRLKQAVKYVLGLKHSEWDDLVIDTNSAKQIRDFIDARLKEE